MGVFVSPEMTVSFAPWNSVPPLLEILMHPHLMIIFTDIRMDTTVLTLYQTILNANNYLKKLNENIMGKGENAPNLHFFPFPSCFLPYQR